MPNGYSRVPSDSGGHGASEGTWTCHTCTLVNQSASVVCSACDAMRPHEHPQGSSGTEATVVMQRPGRWVCPQCAVDNPASTLDCDMCGSANPSPELGSVPPAPSNGPTTRVHDEAVPVPVNVLPSEYKRPDFGRPLFGCCDDMETCCLALWCPCIAVAENVKLALGRDIMTESFAVWGTIACCVGPFWNLYAIYSASQRQRLRARLGIQDDMRFFDLCVHCFCQPCAITQERLEILDVLGQPMDASTGAPPTYQQMEAARGSDSSTSNGTSRAPSFVHVVPLPHGPLPQDSFAEQVPIQTLTRANSAATQRQSAQLNLDGSRRVGYAQEQQQHHTQPVLQWHGHVNSAAPSQQPQAHPQPHPQPQLYPRLPHDQSLADRPPPTVPR